MKVIFLDIDGVLNSYRSMLVLGRLRSDWGQLDPIAVGLMKKLCEETGAKVVISSTWRMLYAAEDFVSNFQKYYGWNIPLVGMTPDSKRGWRGDEIESWVEQNKDLIESYVVIDDDGDMLPHQPFVAVNGIHGFSIFDFHRAWKYLDNSNNHARKFLEDHEDYETVNSGTSKCSEKPPKLTDDEV